MPKKSIDFSKSVFYKIVCSDISIIDVYVGHTTDIKARKYCHKNACNNEKNKNYHLKLYQFIRKNGGWLNFDMVVIHRQSCIDSLEAHTIERKYIETLHSTLNCRTPGRTIEELSLDKGKYKGCPILYAENLKLKSKTNYENRKLISKEPLEIIFSLHNIYTMSNLKQEIISTIKINRPKLGASSIKTYVSILANLHKNMKEETASLDWFSKSHLNIIKYLEDKPDQTKKTAFSALFVLTKKPEYREIMMDVMKKVNSLTKMQQKTVKQEDNWINSEEINKVYEDLLHKATLMLSTKAIFNDNTFIQFLLVAFLSGAAGIPPRRSMDYGEMKIRNYDPKVDNYYKGSKFYFNKYKTAGTYGLQILDVPKTLNTIIKKWIKLNPTDYILYSTNKQKLSSPQINRILNSAFGDKKISTNMLRHIYLSDKYKNIPALESIDRLAEQMGHSSSTALEYVKH